MRNNTNIIISMTLVFLTISIVPVSAVTTETQFTLSESGAFKYYNLGGETWDSARQHVDDLSGTLEVDIRCDGTTNLYDIISRFGLTFDTSSIPDDSYVTGATLKIFIHTVKDGWGDGSFDIVYFYPSNPMDYVDGDGVKFGGHTASTTDFSDIAVGQYTYIPINDLSLINKTGKTTLGLTLTKDTYDDEPEWSSGRLEAIYFYGTTTQPMALNVTYTDEEPEYGETISIAVNALEKYSNAILVNQAVTVNPVSSGSATTKTSVYGETLYFDLFPNATYWFNTTRPGYQNYNETYTIPTTPGIYTIYMERTLTPIENHSYAHFSVVDQTNGGLIPNAEIRLSDGQTKLTNSAGYAWFSVNNSEQINYYVSKPSGFWPAYGAMNLTADESILVALQRYSGPTATSTLPGWTPVTVPTTGTGVNPVVTLSAQLRQQNVQEGMDVWYTNLPFISQFLFLLFIIGGLGLMAGGTRRN